MKKLLFIISTIGFLWNAAAQTNHGHLYTDVNQWSNGTLEGGNMGCYIFNAANNWADARINNNTVWRTAASTRWQNSCAPNTGGLMGTLSVVEAQRDAAGNANGFYLYADPRGNGAGGNVPQISQNINVRPSTTYNFRVRVTTMTRQGQQAPIIGLMVNGTPISTIWNSGSATTHNIGIANCPGGGVAYNGVWQWISGTWTSPATGTGSTLATAAVFCNNPVVGGYDFAMDSFEFTGLGLIDAGADTAFCFADSGTINLGGNPSAAFMANCNNYNVTWSPATGLNNTNILNPVLTKNALSPGTYSYVITVTDDNNRIFRDTVNVTVQVCCELNIKVTRKGCDSFQFEEVYASSMTKKCSYWTLDGDLWDYNGGFVSLNPGSHTICSYMLAYVRSGNQTRNCCMSRCTTITIPVLSHQNIDTSYCELDTALAFDGNFYSPCAYYILSGNPMGNPNFPPYDSRTNGKKIHFLQEGNYHFECYDSNGCLVKIIDINIHRRPKTTTNCYRRVVYCGPAPDPNSILPLLLNCPDCMPPLPGIQYTISNAEFLGGTRYRRTINNIRDCKQCVFEFDLIDSACNWVAEFQITTNTINPNLVNFNLLSPLSNLCGNIVMTVEDLSTGTVTTFTNAAPNGNFSRLFPHLGNYKVCISVSRCICGTTCTKTRCYLISINPQPPLVQYQELPEPGQESAPGKEIPESKPSGATGPQLGISPNPTSSVFHIFLKGVSENENLETIVISDGAGRKVYQNANVSLGTEFNLSSYPAGIYSIKVRFRGSEYSAQLMLID